ncbi:hypothetical protein ARMSODRAFT_448752 [Armillaria solidipes]|uniref:Fatty acid desaturase domain-containing protein n=1 Tax=Armillaria solidipes TaxID=1076256 RepID=A0A2H3BK62_9AGAR|nr:hypothetical protein ARMSODRAFT_448752 [Armillaria solidipes]
MTLRGHGAWHAMLGLWTRPFLIGTLCRYQHQHQHHVDYPRALPSKSPSWNKIDASR